MILGGSSILAVTAPLTEAELGTLETLGWRVTVYDVNGSFIVPGFIDLHVHLTGGGASLALRSESPALGLSCPGHGPALPWACLVLRLRLPCLGPAQPCVCPPHPCDSAATDTPLVLHASRRP